VPRLSQRVGWGFIALYTLAFISTSLLFLAPLAGRGSSVRSSYGSLAAAVVVTVGIAALAALAITVESATGSIRTTLAATPARSAVLTAKAAVVGAVTFPAGLVATVLDYLPAGLSTVLASGTGERYGPEVAALLLGAWAVGVLAVGIVALHRRDP
jgi:hypothetical protein